MFRFLGMYRIWNLANFKKPFSFNELNVCFCCLNPFFREIYWSIWIGILTKKFLYKQFHRSMPKSGWESRWTGTMSITGCMGQVARATWSRTIRSTWNAARTVTLTRRPCLNGIVSLTQMRRSVEWDETIKPRCIIKHWPAERPTQSWTVNDCATYWRLI